MISIIIPTRNRGYSIKKVLNSYYDQQFVTEMIIVDDCGNDNTKEIVEEIAGNYKKIKTLFFRHEKQLGASAARITGYSNAKNDYILFGEDDAYIDKNYTIVLLKKLNSEINMGIVSGRIIYLLPQEEIKSSKIRFKFGIKNQKAFDNMLYCINHDAIISNDMHMPLTHAIFLSKKNLLKKFSYDSFYSKGNGFREESDFQTNVFVNGYNILVTNDTYCYHLNKRDVPTGGQRINRLWQYYWNIYYTNYFFNKYFDGIKDKLNIRYSKTIAVILFSIKQFYKLFIEPIRKIPNWIKEK